MPSTFDPLLRLELQATGENSTSWGTKTNSNLELIAESIAGSITISMSDANRTLTVDDAPDPDEARNAVIVLTGGSLSTTRDLIIPSSSKVYGIYNNTTGGQSIVVRTAAGSGATIPNGTSRIVFCDGTNVTALTPSVNPATNALIGNLTGNVTGNVTGDLTGNVTGDLTGAVTGAASANVLKAGDTMTGDLSLSKATPVLNLNKASSGQNNVVRGLTGASTRWDILLGDGTAESSTATGSNFTISRYNNSGTFIDQPLSIARDTGLVTIQSLSLGASNSIGTSGYVRLPGGIIMQWATINVVDVGTTWTFPIAFPTACLNVQATPTSSLASPVGVNSISTTQAVFDIFGSDSSDTYVMAIGY
jgi:hypothetical protein